MEAKATELGMPKTLYYIFPQRGGPNASDSARGAALGLDDHILVDIHDGAVGGVGAAQKLFMNNPGWGAINLETNCGDHTNSAPTTLTVEFAAAAPKSVTLHQMQHDDLKGANTPAAPTKISPVQSTVAFPSDRTLEIPQISFSARHLHNGPKGRLGTTMASLRHHTGNEPPPHRESFLKSTVSPDPAADERRDEKYQRVLAECDALNAELLAKEQELLQRTRDRMAAPYPYSLLILGARGVGKTALFIQLERQLQSRAAELEQTVRSLAESFQPGGSCATRPCGSPGGDATSGDSHLAASRLTPPRASGAPPVPPSPGLLSTGPTGTPPQSLGASQPRSAAYAHREWRRSGVNLQTVQLYLAAIEGPTLKETRRILRDARAQGKRVEVTEFCKQEGL
eukprot:gene19241-54210_t